MTTTLSSKSLNQLQVALADNTTNDEVRDLLDGSKVAHRPIISATDATVTLTAAQSGSLVVLDRAAGIVVTLPEANADNAGWYCDFVIKTTASGSNVYSIDASRAADLYYGHLNLEVTNAATGRAFFPDQSDDDKIVMGGSDNTTGKMAGGYFRVEIAAANMLVVNGTLQAAATPATPFA